MRATCSLSFRCSAQISSTQLLVCLASSSRKELQWWRLWFFKWGYCGREPGENWITWRPLPLSHTALTPCLSHPLLRKKKQRPERKVTSSIKLRYLGTHPDTHACSLPRIKINPWNCASRNKEEAQELSELESQDIHLLWAHFMSAVDKVSTDQGERNGVAKHGRLLQCQSKHLLKGTEMKAGEKEDWNPGFRNQTPSTIFFFLFAPLPTFYPRGKREPKNLSLSRVLQWLPGQHSGDLPFPGQSSQFFPGNHHCLLQAIPLIQKFQIHIPS